MKMVEVKTAELSGNALGWSVAKAESVPVEFDGERLRKMDEWDGFGERPDYEPWNDWSQGGPLIASLLSGGRWQIVQGAKSGEVWVQNYDKDSIPVDAYSWHLNSMLFASESILIAGCRGLIADKMGDVVSVPAELINEGGL